MNAPALDLMETFVLDTGEMWGAVAHPFQRADVSAVLDTTGPRRHWLMRGRGMSKTYDVAALALALLLTEAPAHSHSYVFAVDTDQAALTMEAIATIVAATGLGGHVQVDKYAVTNKRTKATLTVEASDGASALGLRPWFVIVDELAAWPNTDNHRKLWAAIVGAIPKVPGSRLVVISTAGSPVGLGKRTWGAAEKSPQWHSSRNPGPSPWWTVEDVEATRSDLLPSEWLRFIECLWAEGEDTLTTPEDVMACTRPDPLVLPPRRGLTYVASLDVGSRRDLTALTVAHLEQREGGRHVVVDRVVSWKPSKDQRVMLSEVEATVLRLAKEYRITRLRFDRMQAEQMTQNLAAKGITCDEFVFSTASTNRLARVLGTALRDRAIELPDDPELQTELQTVRIVETGPGTVKMQNPTGTHDDLPTAVAMVAAHLLAQPDVAGGSIARPGGRVGKRSTTTSREALQRPRPGSGAAALLVRQAAQRMPRGLPGGGAIVAPKRGPRP